MIDARRAAAHLDIYQAFIHEVVGRISLVTLDAALRMSCKGLNVVQDGFE